MFEQRAEVAERAGLELEELGERVCSRVLAQEGCDLVGLCGRERRGARWPIALEGFLETHRDREVPRTPVAFTEMREPPRSEVHRVEHEDIGELCVRIALVVGAPVPARCGLAPTPGFGLLIDEAARKGLRALGLDGDEARLVEELGTGGPECVKHAHGPSGAMTRSAPGRMRATTGA